MIDTLFGFLQQFGNVFTWLLESFTNLLANMGVYVGQVYQVINLLPPFLKSSLMGTLGIMFIYTLLRLI